MPNQTYRGLTCHYRNPFLPVFDWWGWIATDGEGEILAHAATLDELKAEIDAYLEDE